MAVPTSHPSQTGGTAPAPQVAVVPAWHHFRRARISAQQGDGFTRAYGRNLANRLPLLYSVVLFDILILSVTFTGTAPLWLTLFVPMVLFAAVGVRAAYWLPSKVAARETSVVARDVRTMWQVGGGGSFVIMVWALALYGHGSTAQQSLIHYITAVTCFTGILGLGHAPKTALGLAVAVMGPSSIFFLLHDHPNRLAVVAVQVFVTCLLLLVSAAYHEDFVSLEQSRQQLAVRERESARLAEANRIGAIRDSLTGANNRRAILALFEQALADPARPRPWLALVDLDGFKHVNDTYGHAAGDSVLCAISDRIEAVPEISAFGRLGGDEFALLISGNHDSASVRRTLDHVREQICRPIHHAGQVLRVTSSIGLHHCLHSSDLGECVERADTALYKAKEAGCGSLGEFTAEDERAMHERRAVTRIFNSADLEKQIAMVYQPIVDCDHDRTVSVEALARWSPDGKDWYPPSRFVSLAETTGRISELTRAVLRKALVECPAWNYGCNLSVNLSARDILRDDAAGWISDIVGDAQAPPERIIFEITETALLTDYRRASTNLEKLRERGFAIALDDFGTGQSSLSHVHNLPLDHLKIDRSFAQSLHNDAGARAIVATILALARQLGLSCTLEGIETYEQLLGARGLGVRLMQGYYFGQPMSAAAALSRMDRAA